VSSGKVSKSEARQHESDLKPGQCKTLLRTDCRGRSYTPVGLKRVSRRRERGYCAHAADDSNRAEGATLSIREANSNRDRKL
jgi:hypothetical protein